MRLFSALPRFSSPLPVTLLVVVAACGAGPDEGAQIHATAYNQTCHADADCVAVVSGDVCSSCACPSGAINRADFGRYESDLTRVESACPTGQALDACACSSVSAACEGEVCTLCPAGGCGDAGTR